MPGGIGAVAYNAIVAQRPAEPGTIVAFRRFLTQSRKVNLAAITKMTCAGSPVWGVTTV